MPTLTPCSNAMTPPPPTPPFSPLRRARHLAERQKKAQKDRAVVELEECFFEPQIRSSATVPEFPATIRDPKRQLGYEPRPYHGKRSADEVAAPTHTPVINERSRAIAEAKYPDAYTDPLTVSKRLAQSPAVRRRRATGGFEKRDEVTGELVAEVRFFLLFFFFSSSFGWISCG